MRKAEIRVNGRRAGELEERIAGAIEYVFTYDASYLADNSLPPVSLTMPKHTREQRSKWLHSFFNGLIPEGWLLDLAEEKFKVDTNDRMGLLLALCRNNIGAVEVIPIGPDGAVVAEQPQDVVKIPSLDGSTDLSRIPGHTECLFCLKALPSKRFNLNYHQECSLKLFGQTTPPILDLSEDGFARIASENLRRKFSLTGVQVKFSGRIFSPTDRMTVPIPGEFIVKPEPVKNDRYKDIAKLELITMRMAASLGLTTAHCGLLYLPSGLPVYVTKRFDRLGDGTKVSVEDFSQILGKTSGNDKYTGSLEQILSSIEANCRQHLLPSREEFFYLSMFNYLIGNNDNHMRNFSLITAPSQTGRLESRLAPAYDLLPTALYQPKDNQETALAIGGRHRNLTRRNLVEFSERAHVGEAGLDRFLVRFRELGPALRRTLDSMGVETDRRDAMLSLVESRLSVAQSGKQVPPATARSSEPVGSERSAVPLRRCSAGHQCKNPVPERRPTKMRRSGQLCSYCRKKD